jgi:hypothetical protein
VLILLNDRYNAGLNKMTRKEEIQELLKQSPSGFLWSNFGYPVFVDQNFDTRWVLSNDKVDLDIDLHAVSPHLRGKTPAEDGPVEPSDWKEHAQWLQSKNVALEIENQKIGAALEKALVESKPQKLKLTPCSEPPKPWCDVLIYRKEAFEGLAYYDSGSCRWIAKFIARTDWPEQSHWSELPEVKMRVE